MDWITNFVRARTNRGGEQPRESKEELKTRERSQSEPPLPLTRASKTDRSKQDWLSKRKRRKVKLEDYPFVPKDQMVKRIWDHFVYGRPADDRKKRVRKEMLGDGSTGSVYTVTQIKSADKTKLKEPLGPFAMKVMKIDDDLNPISFKNEANALSMLKHENIVEFKDAWIDNKRFLLLTSVMKGGCLMDRVRHRTHFNKAQTQHTMRQIVAAVAHCHKHNLVHRNLHTDNFLYKEENGEDIVLIDFGDAIVVDDEEEFDDFTGEDFYLAPEIIRERKGWELKASDCWAMGVICFVLLVGRPPFFGRDNDEILKRILTSKLNRIWQGTQSQNTDRQSRRFVKGLLKRDTRTRYSAVQAMKSKFLTGQDSGDDYSKDRHPTAGLGVLRWQRRDPGKYAATLRYAAQQQVFFWEPRDQRWKESTQPRAEFNLLPEVTKEQLMTRTGCPGLQYEQNVISDQWEQKSSSEGKPYWTRPNPDADTGFDLTFDDPTGGKDNGQSPIVLAEKKPEVPTRKGRSSKREKRKSGDSAEGSVRELTPPRRTPTYLSERTPSREMIPRTPTRSEMSCQSGKSFLLKFEPEDAAGAGIRVGVMGSDVSDAEQDYMYAGGSSSGANRQPLPKPPRSRRKRSESKDSRRILNYVRGPSIVIPPEKKRDIPRLEAAPDTIAPITFNNEADILAEASKILFQHHEDAARKRRNSRRGSRKKKKKRHRSVGLTRRRRRTMSVELDNRSL